ncbi:restriction endonuclease subunit S, partial [Lacticaseibacillus paracasei]|uniref:restriction endonuclease subunit S n=1 Tax=Lacticaseibacillus paracasei TaxID=1597 RepID=UPI002B22B1AF
MSKDAKNIPALRFKGYSDAWEKRKLKNISENLDSQRIPVTASDRIAGQIPYYGANGIQDYVSGYTHSGQIVLLAEDGANSLSQYPVHFIDGKAWVNNHAHAILVAVELGHHIFDPCSKFIA